MTTQAPTTVEVDAAVLEEIKSLKRELRRRFDEQKLIRLYGLIDQLTREERR
jgi:hypothetical protein